MDDVVVNIDYIDTADQQPLVGYWAQQASLPMYDDGVIRWYASDQASRRAAKHIEKVTGIDLRRTRNINKAEIISVRKSPDNPSHSGLATWSSNDPVWRLTSRKGRWYRSTVLHEFCHALGMDHPPDHAAERDTIMSYSRDKSIAKLYPKDIDVLTGLYFDV